MTLEMSPATPTCPVSAGAHANVNRAGLRLSAIHVSRTRVSSFGDNTRTTMSSLTAVFREPNTLKATCLVIVQPDA